MEFEVSSKQPPKSISSTISWTTNTNVNDTTALNQMSNLSILQNLKNRLKKAADSQSMNDSAQNSKQVSLKASLKQMVSSKLYESISKKVNFKKMTNLVKNSINLSSKDIEGDNGASEEPDFGGSKRRVSFDAKASSADKGPIMYESPSPERQSVHLNAMKQSTGGHTLGRSEEESVANSGIHGNEASETLRQLEEQGATNPCNQLDIDPTQREQHAEEEEDEFMDEDDLGFHYISVVPADARIASEKLAKEYNYPDRMVARNNNDRKAISYNYMPKRHITEEFKAFFEEKKPGVEMNEESLAEFELYPRHPKSSVLPKGINLPKNEDEFYPIEVNGTVLDTFNLKVIYDREKTGFEETKEFAIETSGLVAGRYIYIDNLGSAAFSKTYMCKDIVNENLVCLKVINNNKDYFDQSMDEIKLLRYINANSDPDEFNLLKLYDYFYYKEHLIIVTELLKDNLYELYKVNRELYFRNEDKIYFTLGRVQRVAFQLLVALDKVHSLHLVHCDLKPENILVKSISKVEVKIIDFGSSCFIQDHLSSYIQSRSYRAPEVILGCNYDYKIDLWSLGCIIAEIYTGYVLFQNETIQGLLARVVAIIGGIPERVLQEARLVKEYFTADMLLYQPDADEKEATGADKLQLMMPKQSNLRSRLGTDDKEYVDFVSCLLQIDPDMRPTAHSALSHPFFDKVYEDGLTNDERTRLATYKNNHKVHTYGF